MNSKKEVYESNMELFNTVSRHLVTLLKFLKEQSENSQDPSVIEKTLKQASRVDKLHQDVKRVLKTSQLRNMSLAQFEAENVSSDNDKSAKFTQLGTNSKQGSLSNNSSKTPTPKKRNVSHENENRKGLKTKEPKMSLTILSPSKAHTNKMSASNSMETIFLEPVQKRKKGGKNNESMWSSSSKAPVMTTDAETADERQKPIQLKADISSSKKRTQKAVAK